MALPMRKLPAPSRPVNVTMLECLERCKRDMLIWDNRAAMHRAYFDYDPEEYRLLYRVLVRGELPF